MSAVLQSGSYRRRLSAIEEEEFVRYPHMTVGIRCTLRGALDFDAFEVAFTALRQEYAELAGRVEAVGDGFELVVDGSETSAAVFIRTSPDSDNIELNLDETLSMLVVATDGDRHVVTFRCSHAIADGGRLAIVLARLWALYIQVVATGSVGELIMSAAPRPPHEVFAERGIVPGPSDGSERLAGTRWYGTWPTSDALPAGELALSKKYLYLGPEILAGLRAVAKKSNCTFHGLLVGVIATAERELFADLSEDEAVPLGFGSFVDLRSRMSPPVGATEVTNCMTVSYTRLEVTADDDPLTLARSVTEQLTEDISSGLLQQAPLHPPSIALGEPWTVVNYMGATHEMELHANLTIESIEPVFEKDVNLFRGVVAAVDGGAPAPSLPARLYIVYAVTGRLTIQVLDMPGFLSDEAREGLDDRVVELLTEISQRAQA